MKKIIYILLTIGLFISCNKDKDLPYEVNEAYTNLKNKKITLFDTNADLNLIITSLNNIKVQNIEVKRNGNKVTDATITSNSSAKFNSSTLLPFKFGEKEDEPTGSFNISLVSKLSNGQLVSTDTPLKVGHAISFLKNVNSIEYGSKEKRIIEYNISTFSKVTIDKVTLEWKKGKNGTYTLDPEYNALNTEKGSIDAGKNKYNLVVGDTLYYKFVAKRGALLDSIKTSLIVKAQTVSLSGKGQLSKDTPLFSFSTGKQEKEAKPEDPKNEILYTNPTGFKANTDTSITFVKSNLTGDKLKKYYENGLLDEMKTSMDKGTSSNNLSNLIKDQVYTYKITRKNKDKEIISYGVILIGNILNPGTLEEKIDFKYKEGVLKN